MVDGHYRRTTVLHPWLYSWAGLVLFLQQQDFVTTVECEIAHDIKRLLEEGEGQVHTSSGLSIVMLKPPSGETGSPPLGISFRLSAFAACECSSENAFQMYRRFELEREEIKTFEMAVHSFDLLLCVLRIAHDERSSIQVGDTKVMASASLVVVQL